MGRRRALPSLPSIGAPALAIVACMSATVVVNLAAASSSSAATSDATTSVAAATAGHSYRHGVVPMRIVGPSPMDPVPPSGHLTPTGGLLHYNGGDPALPGNAGVVTGPPRVYLVFWGSQWGSESPSGPYQTFSGDPQQIAPDLQAFLSGLGTAGDLWSGVLTQYCEGVAQGSSSCPQPPAVSGTSEVSYPVGGALAGVWEDTSAPAPATATATQLAAEAISAAQQFGNTSYAANRDAQYVIVSPHGTDPDDYQGTPGVPNSGYCAWHDYSSDPFLDGGGGVSSPDGPVAFTNLPYIPDAGSSCGAYFVNPSTGALDGVTIVEGHEYAETMTDQFPAYAWIDAHGNEAADKCAWVNLGVGRARDLTLATGSFAVQTIWGNNVGNGIAGCEFAHAIESDISVTSPATQTSIAGVPVSVAVSATDAVAGRTLTYSAVGLPAGLSIDPSSGVISGTPTTAVTASPVTLVATDGVETGSTALTWTVEPACASNLLQNGGFETGSAPPWSSSVGVVTAGTPAEPSNSGQYLALLAKTPGHLAAHITQRATIYPWCASDTLSLWLHVDTTRAPGTALDTLKVEVVSHGITTVLGTYSNLDAAPGYAEQSYDLSTYAGSKVTVKLLVTEARTAGNTDFAVDDVDLASSP